MNPPQQTQKSPLPHQVSSVLSCFVWRGTSLTASLRACCCLVLDLSFAVTSRACERIELLTLAPQVLWGERSETCLLLPLRCFYLLCERQRTVSDAGANMPSDSEAAFAFAFLRAKRAINAFDFAFSTERSELRAEGELFLLLLLPFLASEASLFCERSERRAFSSCTASRLHS